MAQAASTTHRDDVEAAWLSGDGLTLRADAFGPHDGHPVLFFHGGGQSRRAWSGAARTLGAAGYCALTFDLRGHGESDWAPDGRYDVESYARDLECLVVAFDRPVTLVGASRGGQAALIAAAMRPDRVHLLLLADAAPSIAMDGVDGIRAFMAASLRGFATVDAAADALAALLKRPRAVDAQGLASVMRRGADGRMFWLWDPATASPDFLYPPSERAAVERAARALRCAVMLVRGGASQVVTPESVRHFKALLPTLEVIEIPGAGHMFTGDENDVFAGTLITRLARLEAGTSTDFSPRGTGVRS